MIVRPWGVFGRRYKVGKAGAATYWGCWALVGDYLVFQGLGPAGVPATAAFEIGLIAVVLLGCTLGAVLTTWLGEPVEPSRQPD